MTDPHDPHETPRSFARVDVQLPVRVRLIDEEAAGALGTLLEASPSYSERLAPGAAGTLGGSKEQSWEQLGLTTLLERVERLESALARIADSLEVSLEAEDGWIQGDSVNLSGAGVGVWLPERLPEGSLAELEITLPAEREGRVRAIGRIACLVPPDGEKTPVGRFHLGLAFEHIHAHDQQAIVQYTFRLQRAQLREMRGEEEGD